ncbi:MAG: secondary thiamine-phosphate synthase enzyme YjbQ [Nitrospirota bacterium]|nr:secondary thiamine-phosphate synthase enzyme YjbQ [Nitrospirota bacterium]
MIKQINVKTNARTEFTDITSNVQKVVDESGIKSGVCYVYVPHTTAGVTINEGADPSVVKDILSELNELIPRKAGYLHMEGNSDAHIKTSLIGSSESIIIDKGKLQLGAWQAVFFCEFDGARNRKVMIKVIKG